MKGLHHIIIIDWNSSLVWCLESVLQKKHDIHGLCDYFTIELNNWQKTCRDFFQKFNWFRAITAHVDFFDKVRDTFEFEEELNLVAIWAPQGMVSIKNDTNVALGLAEKSVVFSIFSGRREDRSIDKIERHSEGSKVRP